MVKLSTQKELSRRDEQDKTGKIFVGGIGPDVDQRNLKNFFLSGVRLSMLNDVR